MRRLSVAAARARIAERNDHLDAVLHVLPEPRHGAESGPLAGIPYVLKDTWDTAGIPTTGGSWRHRDRVPSESSHAHLALEEAGAVLLGKSNLCDLAFSAESDNHMRGPVKNPHDASRTAGGSTGGGAAAVADGMAAFDWGTDFGGSIRGPAAFCGLVGLRLSAGTWPVERHHFPRIAPFFWDLCGMGPLVKSVQDARILLDALRGALRRGDHVAAMAPRRVVIWPPDRAHAGDWPSFVEDAARALRSAGVAYEIAWELPTPSQVNALYTEYLCANFDAFVATGELPLREGVPAVLGALASWGRLDKRVHPNTAVLLAAVAGLSLYHRDGARAVARRAALRSAFEHRWARGTLLVAPTTTEVPPRHGRTALATRLMSFCKAGNLFDATAAAVPFGVFRGTRLPRSLQILGPQGSEDAVLALAERVMTSVVPERRE
jgi:aspartyl-tRNA(Asn)/glutamyl-tRNA(Gln) amidotransferase subunit A